MDNSEAPAANMMKVFAAYRELQPLTPVVQSLQDLLNSPVEIMILGEFNAGKSTFINALLQEEVLRSDVTPATATITKLVYGEAPSVVIHFLDGTTRTAPVEELSRLSAEGGDQSYSQLREQIRYVEVRLNNPLLTRVTLMDTPGLNSQNKNHTDTTEAFLKEADAVLWLFSYSSVGRDTEVQALKRLSSTLVPVGIINSIDIHDPEEEDLDDFLRLNEQRLRGLVSGVYGVSALQALQSRSDRESLQWRESRFEQLYGLIESLSGGERFHALRKKRLLRAVEQFLESLKGILTARMDEYVRERHMIMDYDGYRQSLLDKKEGLERKRNKWKEARQGTGYKAYQRLEYPLPVAEGDKLLQQYEQQMYFMQELQDKNNHLAEKYKLVAREGSELQLDRKQLNKDWEVYNHSGIVFNKPLLDWSGKKAVLQERERAMNKRLDAYRAMYDDWHAKKGEADKKWAAGERELRGIGKRIESQVKNEIDKLQAQFEDRSELTRAVKSIEHRMWILNALGELNGVVKPALLQILGGDRGEWLQARLAWVDNYDIRDGESASVTAEVTKRKAEARRAVFKRTIKYTSAAMAIVVIGSLGYYWGMA